MDLFAALIMIPPNINGRSQDVDTTETWEENSSWKKVHQQIRYSILVKDHQYIGNMYI